MGADEEDRLRRCHNCHNFDSFDYAEQGRRSCMHQTGLNGSKTCIDCHRASPTLPEKSERAIGAPSTAGGSIRRSSPMETKATGLVVKS